MNSTSDLLIRPASEQDLDDITAIYADAVLHGLASFETTPPDRSEMAKRRDALVAGGHPYLVAEAESHVLGYAYAGPYRTRPAYRNTVESSVYVAPDARGRSVGRRLLQAILVEAKALGFRQMVAIIGDSANHASIRIHESCGFDTVGTLRSVGRKHGRWLDSVIMQRTLGPGDSTPPDTETPGPSDSR